MAFNNITNGDPFDATKAMQNWRNVNYGSTLLPVNSSGAAVNATIDLGSSSNAFKDGFFSGQVRATVQPFLYLHSGSKNSTGIDHAFTVGENTGGFTTTAGKLAVPSPGIYIVNASGFFSLSETNKIQRVYINAYNSSDTLIFSENGVQVYNTAGLRFSITSIIRMAAGDYIGVYLEKDGNANLIEVQATIYKLPS